MRFRDQRHRLGPGQRRPFAIGVDGRLAPGVQEIEALLGFSMLARVLGVHVDAERTAVDLRGPGLDQLDQRLFKTAALDLGFQRAERLDGVGRGPIEIHSWFHGHCPFEEY